MSAADQAMFKELQAMVQARGLDRATPESTDGPAKYAKDCHSGCNFCPCMIGAW